MRASIDENFRFAEITRIRRSRRVNATSGATRRGWRGEGRGRKRHAACKKVPREIDFISPRNVAGSRDFDCNREQPRCARPGPRPGRAVPLNPTGITCAGHNMSGSIKIRTAQIKLSLRPMSDRGYLAGCELPHVLPGPRCDSRMRRTHPHN